ncbi:unnamed protein product [Ectocarpus sp. CCAP 1310/34]|nr:unnamed protein product [Ectocarpus sp. CCAP 1310/34]
MGDRRKRGAPTESSGSLRPRARARPTHTQDVLNKLKAIAAIVLVVTVATSTVIQRLAPKARQPIHEPRRLDWDEHLEDVRRRKLFRRMYRMEEHSFNKLADLLRPILERNDFYARDAV